MLVWLLAAVRLRAVRPAGAARGRRHRRGPAEPVVSALRTLDSTTSGGAGVENAAAPLYVSTTIQGRLAVLFDTRPGFDRRIAAVESAFDDTETTSAMATGAVLGRFTKFGLTGAPAVIVGVGVVGAVLVALELAGVGPGPLGNWFGALLALLASLVAFPWAMLFADGGTPELGFVSVVLVLAVLFGGSLSGIPLLGSLDLVAYVGLMGVASLHLRDVVAELRAA